MMWEVIEEEGESRESHECLLQEINKYYIMFDPSRLNETFNKFQLNFKPGEIKYHLFAQDWYRIYSQVCLCLHLVNNKNYVSNNIIIDKCKSIIYGFSFPSSFFQPIRLHYFSLLTFVLQKPKNYHSRNE